MRATRAYITGFGTTGLLISAALLSLAVMSAFVAFNGFPGQDVQDPIGTLLVQEKQAAVKVPAKPIRVDVAAATRAATTSGHRAATRRAHAPKASTGPVLQRAPARTAPGQAPSSGQNPTSVAQTAPTTPLSTTPPSVPNTGVQIPPITLPSLPSSPPASPPPPPSGGVNTQLPVDTSGITGILGG